MSLMDDALQPFLVRGLTTLQGRSSGMSLADLIGKQNKVGFDLDFDNQKQSIETNFRDPFPVLDSIASDSSRFAAAAFQTMQSISTKMGERTEISWCLIQAYYSAFYAGHSIIRLLGQSCSYLSRSHVTQISILGAAYGKAPGFRLTASIYQCNLDSSASSISSKSLRNGPGGAHEAFWNVFGLRIRRINEVILLGLLGQYEAQSVFVKLDSLLHVLCSDGTPLFSWLSAIRNEIQYRHEHGVWLPCDVKKQDRERLGRFINQWQRDPMEIDVGAPQGGKLGQFVVGCAFIVALCRSLLTRIVERSEPSGRSFAKLGPLAVLRPQAA